MIIICKVIFKLISFYKKEGKDLITQKIKKDDEDDLLNENEENEKNEKYGKYNFYNEMPSKGSLSQNLN